MLRIQKPEVRIQNQVFNQTFLRFPGRLQKKSISCSVLKNPEPDPDRSFGRVFRVLWARAAQCNPARRLYHRPYPKWRPPRRVQSGNIEGNVRSAIFLLIRTVKYNLGFCLNVFQIGPAQGHFLARIEAKPCWSKNSTPAPNPAIPGVFIVPDSMQSGRKSGWNSSPIDCSVPPSFKGRREISGPIYKKPVPWGPTTLLWPERPGGQFL